MVLPRCERRRLCHDEIGWNLVRGISASRTRGGGHGRPNLDRATTRPNEIPATVISEDATTTTIPTAEAAMGTSDEDASSSEEDDTTMMALKKPPHSRVIVEVLQLQQAFQHFPCPKCNQHLELKLRTVCLATNIELICNNKECSYVCDFARPSQTSIHNDVQRKYERITDYAVNVLYILGFISVGGGHTEAGRLLGLLGLPNDTTMMNRSFGIVEDRIEPFIRQLCDEILTENMDEEAKLSMNEFDYNVWKMWINDESLGPLPVARRPQIDASYDMAWQQKGSGHVYNSQSGHGSLFGRYTRKIIGLVIKSKLCCECSSWNKKHPDFDVPEHHCWKNHDGSSGSMESSGAVDVLVDAFDNKKVVISRLCCDDDSSIRADCQWSNADYLKNNNTDVLPMVKKKHGKNKHELQPRPDKGKLPAHVPEPIFVADPNHRRKGLTGELIKLDASKADVKMTMTRMDSTRIGKNFGYMARTLKDRPPCEHADAAKACLEHHFDNHIYCGDWCKRKNETAEETKASIKYYRCKNKDAKLYTLLSDKMSRFITPEQLNDMEHSLDTNMNEAFNQICTWFAPKNKVFAGTGSLPNRISLAVGINSLGVEVYFKRLFKKMGIPLTDNVEYYLRLKERTRVNRLQKLKTCEAKIKKNKRKYNKLAEHTKIAKKELLKREGMYRRGMNLDDPFGNDAVKPAAKKTKGSSAKFCEYCGHSDHLTRRSAKCTAKLSSVKRYNKDDGRLLLQNPLLRIGATAEPDDSVSAALLAREDCDHMDSLPFDAES